MYFIHVYNNIIDGYTVVNGCMLVEFNKLIGKKLL